MSDQENAPFDSLSAQRDIARRRAAREVANVSTSPAAPGNQQRRVIASGWDKALESVLSRRGREFEP